MTDISGKPFFTTSYIPKFSCNRWSLSPDESLYGGGGGGVVGGGVGVGGVGVFSWCGKDKVIGPQGLFKPATLLQTNI